MEIHGDGAFCDELRSELRLIVTEGEFPSGKIQCREDAVELWVQGVLVWKESVGRRTSTVLLAEVLRARAIYFKQQMAPPKVESPVAVEDERDDQGNVEASAESPQLSAESHWQTTSFVGLTTGMLSSRLFVAGAQAGLRVARGRIYLAGTVAAFMPQVFGANEIDGTLGAAIDTQAFGVAVGGIWPFSPRWTGSTGIIAQALRMSITGRDRPELSVKGTTEVTWTGAVAALASVDVSVTRRAFVGTRAQVGALLRPVRVAYGSSTLYEIKGLVAQGSFVAGVRWF